MEIKVENLMVIGIIYGLVVGGLLGYGLTIYFNNNNSEVVGLYIKEKRIEDVDMYLQKNPDYEGDWVIIDVQWLTYLKAEEICRHEVAHHIFNRRNCKENPKECLGIDETEEYAEFCESNIGICIENEGISMP